MAAITFDASVERQVEKKYRLWRAAQPRELNQLGGKTWIDVKGGPYPDNTLYMQLPDGFVDELEGSGTPFKRQ